jgi:hypothetical protein
MRMHQIITSCLIAALGVFSGCVEHYTPKVDLSESPATIPITVELHRFKEASEAKMPGQPYGLVAPGTKMAEPGELIGPITDAVLEDLRKNHVFKHIDTFAQHPDVILTGRVRKFYETYKPKVWTRLPGANVLAKLIEIDTYTATAEVDLDIILLGPNGARIRTYQGHAAKTDDFVPSKQNEPGARLNWALSEALQQVRQSLLHDQRLVSEIPGTRRTSSDLIEGEYAHGR